MRTIQGKRTLLTGAASGIGRELALKLAAEGAHLALVDRNESGLKQLSTELGRFPTPHFLIVADLSDPASIHQIHSTVMAEWNGLDILVNNAGLGLHGPTHELTESQRDEILQVNLNAPFALFHAFVHQLLNTDQGHLVNVSSFLGLVPQAQTTAYSVTKYGLVGLSESLRAEYSRWGLGVSVICPGFVRTPLLDNLPETTKEGVKLSKPPRWLTTTPEKIAAKTIRAIQRNRRLTLATPLAHCLYHAKRLFPGAYDFVQTFQSSKWKQILGLSRTKKRSADSNVRPAVADSNASQGDSEDLKNDLQVKPIS